MMKAVLLIALLTLPQAEPQSAVSGTIVDTTGSTVPGAIVQLEAAGVVVAQVQTSSDGRFSFIASPDRSRLIVMAPGFANRVVALGSDASSLTIELEPAPFFEAVQGTSSRGEEPQTDPTVAASVLGSADVVSSPAAAIDDILK